MKIWLDDLRPAPWGYESARSVNEAKTLIREAERNGIEIEVLDLDHDLGDFANQGGDAIKLLDWLVERETFYPVESKEIMYGRSLRLLQKCLPGQF